MATKRSAKKNSGELDELLPPKTLSLKDNERKWGKTIWEAGWTGVPMVLLERQHTLKLTPTEFNVLIQLLKFWWIKERLPYPSKSHIAKAMGVSPATIRRAVTKMVAGGLIERISRRNESGQRSNRYSFEGLIKSLSPFAKDSVALKKRQKGELAEFRTRKKARPE